MDYKKLYLETLKGICEQDRSKFPNIIEQERPDFMDIVEINENAKDHALFSFKLDENLATQKDYKDFCEYIYTYIGYDFDEIIGKAEEPKQDKTTWDGIGDYLKEKNK